MARAWARSTRAGCASATPIAAFDAEAKFGVGYGAAAGRTVVEEPEGCGLWCRDDRAAASRPIARNSAPAARQRCRLGALMVSSEGACAAYYQYGGARAGWRRRNEHDHPYLPACATSCVTLAHGGGGKAMRDLIEDVFTAAFQPPGMEDQARLKHDDAPASGGCAAGLYYG